MTRFLIALGLIVVFIPTSCKKGEEDPTISFRSRTSRLANEWKLSEYRRSEVNNTGQTSYVSNLVLSATGSSLEMVVDDTNTKVFILKEVDLSLNITKDQIYDLSYAYEFEEERSAFGNTSKYRTVYKYSEEGKWEWLNGGSNYRKKERVLLQPISKQVITNEYQNDQLLRVLENKTQSIDDYAIQISQLRHDKLSFRSEYSAITESLNSQIDTSVVFNSLVITATLAP